MIYQFTLSQANVHLIVLLNNCKQSITSLSLLVGTSVVFSYSHDWCHLSRFKAVLLLWIFYVFVMSCVSYVFVCVSLWVLCDHLLGKGWPLGSRLWCLTVSLSLSHWYPGSGVVLDCIDSWSLHPYLLSLQHDLLGISFCFMSSL